MAETRTAGAILRANTVATGVSLALIVRILELGLEHGLFSPQTRSWQGLIAFLGETEVQILGTTLVAWASNRVRSWGIGSAVDAGVAARVQQWLKRSGVETPQGRVDA